MCLNLKKQTQTRYGKIYIETPNLYQMYRGNQLPPLLDFSKILLCRGPHPQIDNSTPSCTLCYSKEETDGHTWTLAQQ